MYHISTSHAPAATGPYSQGMSAARFVFVSGQPGCDPAHHAFAEGIAAQTRQCLDNVAAILREVGLDLCNIIKTTVFMVDLNDLDEMNRVYDTYFSSPQPARSCVQVVGLPNGGLIQIEAIALR